MTETSFKLGKAPARPGAIKLQFSAYLTKALPKPPVTGGHLDLIQGVHWEMLGNDKYGDCVWAGAAHETMLWNDLAKTSVTFTDDEVLAGYSAVTGFKPSDPSTDQGTDMQLAAKYRQDTGLVDTQGKVHKVGAYLAINTPTEVRQAIHLFGACGIGIEFPDSAMVQFNHNQDWEVVPKAKVEGGHYIPGVFYSRNYCYVITWGKLIKASWPFITKYMDEGVVYLSDEMLTNGKSLEGFDLAQLQADLAAIKSNGKA